MHIPNGFLDPKISTGFAFGAAAVLGYCIVKVKQAIRAAVPKAVMAGIGNVTTTVKNGMKSSAENTFARMGAIGSLIFAGQMFNFPIADGTSGHLLGGIIAAVALGPFAGAVVMAAVLFVQSIFFADGGITVLGANIFNMAVIGAFACYYIYYFIHRIFKNNYGYYAGIGLASFSAVFIASIICSLQLTWSGMIGLRESVSAMASVHAIIGIAEVLLTIMALEILRSMKFELDGELKHE